MTSQKNLPWKVSTLVNSSGIEKTVEQKNTPECAFSFRTILVNAFLLKV